MELIAKEVTMVQPNILGDDPEPVNHRTVDWTKLGESRKRFEVWGKDELAEYKGILDRLVDWNPMSRRDGETALKRTKAALKMAKSLRAGWTVCAVEYKEWKKFVPDDWGARLEDLSYVANDRLKSLNGIIDKMEEQEARFGDIAFGRW